mgnify:CR=1 FL=1
MSKLHTIPLSFTEQEMIDFLNKKGFTRITTESYEEYYGPYGKQSFTNTTTKVNGVDLLDIFKVQLKLHILYGKD